MSSTALSTIKKFSYNAIAGYAALRLALWAAKSVYHGAYYLSRRFRSLRSIYATPGKTPYAVITGGSEGLGLAFARRLGREGFSILIISRDQEKLNKAEVELRQEFPAIDVKTLSLDLGKEDCTKEFEVLEQFAQVSEIAILINNLGAFGWGEYGKQDINRIELLLRLNVIAPAGTARAVLPTMIQRSARSAIINVSSFQSFGYVPQGIINCASKNFSNYLIRSLAAEYSSQKVDCLVLSPGYIATNALVEVARENPSIRYTLWTCTPEAVVNACLNSLKVAAIKNDNLTYGTFNHALMNKACQSTFIKKHFRYLLFPVS